MCQPNDVASITFPFSVTCRHLQKSSATLLYGMADQTLLLSRLSKTLERFIMIVLGYIYQFIH